MISNKQKAILHIAKAQLGLSDEEYRMILRIHGGRSHRSIWMIWAASG
jgi:hypothetical protein